MIAAKPSVTLMQYQALQDAYDLLNEYFFSGSLPQVMISLHRHRFAAGYFAPGRYSGRQGQGAVHELALNPDTFGDRSDLTVCSTLLHEMCHVWQQECGTPGKGGYHNAEWAQKMLTVGLSPVSVDRPGTMLGYAVTHEIVPDGPFAKWWKTVSGLGPLLGWQSGAPSPVPPPTGPAVPPTPAPPDDTPRAKAKRRSKTKYTCPVCGQNAWAKPSADLVCGRDGEVMEPEDDDDDN